MNTTQLKQIISDTDAAIAKANPVDTAAVNARVVTGVEISAAISLGIVVLKAVVALLWWKPKWQAAINNVIDVITTFESVTGL